MLLPASVKQECHVLRVKLLHEAMQIAILIQINLCLNFTAMNVVLLPAATNCYSHKLIKTHVIRLPVRRLAFTINTQQALQFPLDQCLGFLPLRVLLQFTTDLHRLQSLINSPYNPYSRILYHGQLFHRLCVLLKNLYT